jgi:hypothetical protein
VPVDVSREIVVAKTSDRRYQITKSSDVTCCCRSSRGIDVCRLAPVDGMTGLPFGLPSSRNRFVGRRVLSSNEHLVDGDEMMCQVHAVVVMQSCSHRQKKVYTWQHMQTLIWTRLSSSHFQLILLVESPRKRRSTCYTAGTIQEN